MTLRPRKDTRILVVDDNPAVLKLLGALFEERGTTVTLAASVAQAKEALIAESWDFDLVLSDIQMPRETGFDLLRWIKREDSPSRDLPVLLTTAQLPEAENRVKGLALGAVDYVVRPIELSELVLRAEHAVESYKRVRLLEMSLQDSAKLANVGRLLAASHHEIKNLATLISLATEQAVRCFGSTAHGGAALALRSLTQTAALLTDVSRNVSGMLDPGAIAVAPVDLGRLVDEVVELMQPQVRPFRLEATPLQNPLWALAHPVRLKQILINLILNAVDAVQELDSAAGGSIRVTVAAEAEGGMVRLSVVDDGMGFEPPGERCEFQAFATTKKMRGGQGLGLWLCAELARGMGGRMTLSSRGTSEGAEASVTLRSTTPAVADDLDVARYLAELDD